MINDALLPPTADNLTTATILLNAELRLEYMKPGRRDVAGGQRPAQPRASHQ